MRLSFMTPAIVQARRRTAHPEKQAISLDQQVSTAKPNDRDRPARITLLFFTDSMVHACACGPSRPMFCSTRNTLTQLLTETKPAIPLSLTLADCLSSDGQNN